MKLESDKSSIGKFLRSSFSSKKASKKQLSQDSSSLSSTSTSSLSSTASSSSNAEPSDAFFGMNAADTTPNINIKNAENDYAINEKILSTREATLSNENNNKKKSNDSDLEKAATSNSASDFFAQISQKFEARPKIQKLGEKLKTLIAPREQQHFVHFRRLFEAHIAEGDNLIMTFPCSYQSKSKDFPLHGRIYLTLSMIGFSSSLFGYEKKIIIPFNQVTSLRKDRSSRFSLNSIKIVTHSGEKHSFGSLKGRDRIYSLLFRVLRMNSDPDNRDSMIEDDDEEIDQLKTGTDDNKYVKQMTASDTSSEGSDEQSVGSSSSSNPSNSWQPNEVITPVIPVECPCREHKGRKLLDIELPLSVQQTFQLFFTDNEWIHNFEDALKRSEKKQTSWTEDDSTGKKERVCYYTVELDKTFGPKFTRITETQICNPIISYNEGYSVLKEAINEGVPYSDSFSVECTYCVTKVTESSSRLKVHGGITFRKYIFGLIKNVIERSTITGLDVYYTSLNQRLKSDEDKLLSYIMDGEASVAEDALTENGMLSRSDSTIEAPSNPSNPSSGKVVSVSNLKEAAENQPSTALPQSEAQTVTLLKVISVLLMLILLSNIYFHFSSHRVSPSQMPIPSGPSPSTLQELAELRKLVVSLESRFSAFVDGAKKEL